MQRSRSEINGLEPMSPDSSSRSFLKYFGLEAYQRPSRQRSRASSPTESPSLEARARSKSSASLSQRSVQSSVRDQVSTASLSPRVSRSSSRSGKIKRDGDGEDFPSFWARARSPSGTSTMDPCSEEGIIYEEGTPSSPPLTSHITPSLRRRKFSLPLFPLWNTTSAYSESSADTPPLSPSTDRAEILRSISPPQNTRRRSMRTRARFGSIEALNPFIAPQPTAEMAGDTIPQSSFPLALPPFDFEVRRTARSVDHDAQSQTSSKQHLFSFPEEQDSDILFQDDSSRTSTFFDIDSYLSQDGDFFRARPDVVSENASFVDLDQILGRNARSTRSNQKYKMLRSTKSALQLTPSRRDESLHQKLSSFQFPPAEVTKVISQRGAQDVLPMNYVLKPLPSIPLERSVFETPTPSVAELPVAFSPAQYQDGLPRQGREVDAPSIRRPSHASDSLEAARAAIDRLAGLPLEPYHENPPLPRTLSSSSSSRSPSQPAVRPRKISQALSRRVFHLPGSRSSTPGLASVTRSSSARDGSETDSRLSADTDTDTSFLLTARSIAPHWPLPPSQPEPSLSPLLHKVPKRSRSTPALLASASEYSVTMREIASSAAPVKRETPSIEPELRYSLFVVSTDSVHKMS